jgi:hypothetical protein
VVPLHPRLYLARCRGELFGIEPATLETGFGRGRFPAPTADGGTIDLGNAVRVRFVRTPAAQPELVNTVGKFTIMSFDGLNYALPHWLGPVAWDSEDVAAIPGVFTSKDLAEVFAYVEKGGPPAVVVSLIKLRRLPIWLPFLLRKIVTRGPGKLRRIATRQWIVWGNKLAAIATRKKAPPAPALAPAKSRAAIPLKTLNAAPPTKSVPVLVGALDGYNVLEYEGWFYGLPQALGPLDLGQTDVIETPGVIRDVSRDVVETEIRELTRTQRSAA